MSLLMRLRDFFLAQLGREAVSTRKAIERVPEGQNRWAAKPCGKFRKAS
jgi:hypothetical protein